jgi:YlmC/YmxH family sporulation protein
VSKKVEIQLSYQELRNKDVVNVIDGKKLGRILDVVFDIRGHIEGLVTPGLRRFVIFKPQEDVFISWCDIKKIGDDVILVELRPRILHDKKEERREARIEERHEEDWHP